MKINFLTTNNLKFKIAQQCFSGLQGYELFRHDFSVPEIQDVSCEQIALNSAVQAAKEIGEPCVVSDAGFFIEALGSFPGPFVKYLDNWFSGEQLLGMLKDNDSRKAYFIGALAIGFPDGRAAVFSQQTNGSLVGEGEYTPSGWLASSLFIPEDYTLPLASMSEQEQADFWSNENKTWQELVEYLKKNP